MTTPSSSPAGPEVHAGAYEAVHDMVMVALEWIVLSVNLVCAAVLVWGVIVGAVLFLRLEIERKAGDQMCWPTLRQRVGQYLLFGLELLIAADIIETMIRPTLSQLGILAGVTLIRIITGYALGKELIHLTDAPGGAGEKAGE